MEAEPSFNYQLAAETTGRRVLELVRVQDVLPESEALPLPAPIRPNRLDLSMDRGEMESHVEFIERFASDLYKMDKGKIFDHEVNTFCQKLPKWQYQKTIIEDRSYGVLRRNENIVDLSAFAENRVERRIAWSNPELVVLVKDVQASDLLKIIDIEHHIALNNRGIDTPDLQIIPSAGQKLLAKARALTSSQRQVVEMLFSPAGEIAAELEIATSTVRTHIHNAMIALETNNQRQLVIFGIQTGLINMDDIPSAKTRKLSHTERNILIKHYTSSYKEAADTLGVTTATVRSHWNSIYTKTGAINRTQAAIMGVKDGLIRLAEEN